ncbi:glycosyltransferase family 4 protein [Flavobacterium sp. LPB0248]|nr:glycosyltransferase family 4 protein [Flavobacterium sp. LPB0248]
MFNDVESKFNARFKFLFKPFFFILRYFFFIYYIIKLDKVFNVDYYDELMIINGGYPGGWSCRAATIFWGLKKKKKSIHNFHNFAEPPRLIVKMFENFIDSLVNKYTSFFVTVSKVCMDSLKKRESIKQNKNIQFIYNGIGEKSLVLPVNIRKELGLDRESKICLLLATFEKRKGHKFLIDVFQEVFKTEYNAFLVCCGYGSKEERLSIQNYINSLGLAKNIFLLDYREDAASILADSDLLVISSKEFESFGLTAIEGMKHSIAVISTNTGGLKEVIADGEGGFLFDYGDVDGFSGKVKELLRDNSKRIDQGKLGRERFVNYFTANKMAKSYRDLMNSNNV